MSDDAYPPELCLMSGPHVESEDSGALVEPPSLANVSNAWDPLPLGPASDAKRHARASCQACHQGLVGGESGEEPKPVTFVRSINLPLN